MLAVNTQRNMSESEGKLPDALQPSEDKQLLPLVSAADAGRSNRDRCNFDEYISEMLDHMASRRAPKDTNTPDRDKRNHLIGVATEVGTATWTGGQIDRRIFDDFEGDDAVDVIAPSKWGSGMDRYQVKATRDFKQPERVVSEKELKNCDYFVLCCTTAPKSYVEIVGYTDALTLKVHGQSWGRDGYLLSGEILDPLSGRRYTPDDVRDTLY